MTRLVLLLSLPLLGLALLGIGAVRGGPAVVSQIEDCPFSRLAWVSRPAHTRIRCDPLSAQRPRLARPGLRLTTRPSRYVFGSPPHVMLN